MKRDLAKKLGYEGYLPEPQAVVESDEVQVMVDPNGVLYPNDLKDLGLKASTDEDTVVKDGQLQECDIFTDAEVEELDPVLTKIPDVVKAVPVRDRALEDVLAEGIGKAWKTEHLDISRHESTINDQIAAILRDINTDWLAYDLVISENTDTFFKGKGLRPDILIIEQGVPPIVVETEYQPALTVEADAASRLGKVVIKSGGTIQTAFAIKIPARFKVMLAKNLKAELRSAQDFEYCVLSGPTTSDFTRWPASGYVPGSLENLFVALQGAAIPQSAILKGADALEAGAANVAAIMDSMAVSRPGVIKKISECLKQEANLQTYRMAATILINAFVFQENLAGRPDGLEDVLSLQETITSGTMTKTGVIAEWTKILKINYWPIFGIARSLLQAIPANIAADILKKMHNTASTLLTLDLGKSSDLSGVIFQIFQRLISDRRFLATFYTTPASAALLNGFLFNAATAPNGKAWTDPEVSKLRIGDFACGTGSLLSGAYSEVRRHLEINGVSARAMHSKLIEDSFVGCDVMPSATHITASMLSSAFPEQRYKHTNILTLPFGRQPDGSVSLGTIEFLSKQGALSIIDTGALTLGGMGASVIDPWVVMGGAGVEDGTFDVIIMNPPFTRLTGGGGKTSDIPMPMFAAFGTVEDEQKLMSTRAQKLTLDTCAHGNAGEASIFLQIAHNKLKVGGHLGLVLPITFLSGVAWDQCRELIRKNYSDIIVVTIASSKSGSFAFSADTDTGECLLIARKTAGKPATSLASVSLTTKATTPFEGTEIARLICKEVASKSVAALEDGPIGGTPVQLGSVRIGEMLTGPIRANDQWPLFRIADHTVAQVAHALLANSLIWLPGMAKVSAQKVDLCSLADLGTVGPYHLDINGPAKSGGAARGPFEIKGITPGHSETYHVLSAHNAENERTLEINHDAVGIPRVGETKDEKDLLTKRREAIWATRSHLHFNTDFRFNSQSLAFAITEEESIGGRAWPSFKMKVKAHDIIASLWGNSTFGLLTFWWSANKSQDGRGSITTTQIPRFMILDPRQLTAAQHKKAATFFDSIKTKALEPAHEIGTDNVRARIDDFILRDLLNAGVNFAAMSTALSAVREKLGLEPSFNGGKALRAATEIFIKEGK